MKTFIAFCIATGFALTLQAQIPHLEWARGVGDTLNEAGSGVAVDQWGNAYFTGVFEGTTDFDPGPGTYFLSPNGQYDFFVLKLDPAGNFIWACSIGGLFDDVAFDIVAEPSDSNNIYITGSFTGTVDFDPGPGIFFGDSYQGSPDVFVLKLSPNGAFIWVRVFGSWGNDAGMAVALDTSDHIFTTGYFEEMPDFDPGPGEFIINSNGFSDAFIHKMDLTGNFISAFATGGTGKDYGYDLASPQGSGIVAIGTFEHTVDLNPGPLVQAATSLGLSDIFLQSLDPDLNLGWAATFGGTGDETGEAVTTDHEGYIYTTGFFQDKVDFDPGLSEAPLIATGTWDAFVQKLDHNGNYRWAVRAGGTDQTRGKELSADTDGNVYAIGNFEGTVDFDPGSAMLDLTSFGLQDIFVLKLGKEGDLKWVRNCGSPKNDGAPAIAVDPQRNIYFTGHFRNNAEFDPGPGVFLLLSAGDADFFAAKWDQVPDAVYSPALETPVVIYPNPTTGAFTLTYQLDEPAPVTITLRSLVGRELIRWTNNEMQIAGTHHFEAVLPETLPPGLYSISLRTAFGEWGVKVVKE